MLILNISLQELLLGEEQWDFLLETVLRSVVMFIVILIGLRTLGKRGVTQLSVFELGVIIGLGSAAGDPMFYKDVGLLVGTTVLIVVLSLYKLLTFLINRSDRIEEAMEGKPSTVLMNGCLQLRKFDKEPIARDELFSQLRVKSISHLGQVRQAVIETNGEVSVFYFADKDVQYGLPILPEFHEQKIKVISKKAYYSCTMCGQTEILEPAKHRKCKTCGNDEWIAAQNDIRIT